MRELFSLFVSSSVTVLISVQRLNAELAATICQMHLWAPSPWISKAQLPSNSEVMILTFFAINS